MWLLFVLVATAAYGTGHALIAAHLREYHTLIVLFFYLPLMWVGAVLALGGMVAFGAADALAKMIPPGLWVFAALSVCLIGAMYFFVRFPDMPPLKALVYVGCAFFLGDLFLVAAYTHGGSVFWIPTIGTLQPLVALWVSRQLAHDHPELNFYQLGACGAIAFAVVLVTFGNMKEEQRRIAEAKIRSGIIPAATDPP